MTDYEASRESLESAPIPDWFRDETFGLYFHWGPYSVPTYGNEWYSARRTSAIHATGITPRRTGTDEFGYREFIPEFHGDEFDSEEWGQPLCGGGC